MENAEDRIIVGHRYEWGGEKPFFLGIGERRQHVYLIGQTGAGKSTLLRNLLLQDIEAGRGVGFIDPHGDLALDILDNIPPSRTRDVVYFDPSGPYPLALNMFRSAGDNWYLTATGIVSAFKKIWGDSWGPRLEYVFTATVGALIQAKDTSLLGVSRMMYDEQYRARVVSQVTDPMIRSFWLNEFPEYDRSYRQETVGPIQNKVGQIMMSPALRSALGQVGTKINFRFMMDNRRIFIANLSKGMLGETPSNLLGSLLVTGFELAAQSRANTPAERREDFFLTVDEFSNCATESFAGILSEARKYRLSLTLAHQYLAQLPGEKLREGIFGNVGTIFSFRVSQADAAILEQQFGGAFTRSHFTNLNNFEFCARMLNGEPFLAMSSPPTLPPRRRRRKVRRHSRKKYGKRKESIEEKIKRWIS